MILRMNIRFPFRPLNLTCLHIRRRKKVQPKIREANRVPSSRPQRSQASNVEKPEDAEDTTEIPDPAGKVSSFPGRAIVWGVGAALLIASGIGIGYLLGGGKLDRQVSDRKKPTSNSTSDEKLKGTAKKVNSDPDTKEGSRPGEVPGKLTKEPGKESKSKDPAKKSSKDSAAAKKTDDKNPPPTGFQRPENGSGKR